MVIEENEILIDRIRKSGYLKSKSVEEAIRSMPRHLFLPDSMRDLAYLDAPLALGYRQTISQPTTVIAMTEALEVRRGQKVLEIGTGSGWQASILSYLVGNDGSVFSLEIVKELAEFARENLKKAGISNVKVLLRDGSLGMEEEAPFDRIIVTAASPEIPGPLIEQLKVGGIMVIPIGSLYFQEMIVARKTEKGIKKRSIGDFNFVPLLGRHGFKRF
jgi:protein-L-isoaspartate(D-aspartate) O-methyltransferase